MNRWIQAKHYGVGVDPCPPRRPNRKGVVEKAIHYIAQRWWRTAAVGTLSDPSLAGWGALWGWLVR